MQSEYETEVRIDEDWDTVEVYGQRYRRSDVKFVFVIPSSGESVVQDDYCSHVSRLRIILKQTKTFKDEQAIKELQELLAKWRAEGKEGFADDVEFAPKNFDNDWYDYGSGDGDKITDYFENKVKTTEIFEVHIKDCKFYKIDPDRSFKKLLKSMHNLTGSYPSMNARIENLSPSGLVEDVDCPPDSVYFMNPKDVPNPSVAPSWGSGGYFTPGGSQKIENEIEHLLTPCTCGHMRQMHQIGFSGITGKCSMTNCSCLSFLESSENRMRKLNRTLYEDGANVTATGEYIRLQKLREFEASFEGAQCPVNNIPLTSIFPYGFYSSELLGLHVREIYPRGIKDIDTEKFVELVRRTVKFAEDHYFLSKQK